MSIEYKYYPALSEKINEDSLPDSLSFIKDIFEDIYYKNYYESKNTTGSYAFYSLDIVSRRHLEQEIFNTGISLLLNPDYEDSTISSFSVTVFWQWKILQYIRNFTTSSFSYTPEGIFDLVMNILNISKEKILIIATDSFVYPEENSAFEQLIIDINTFYNSSITVDETDEDRYTQLVTFIEELEQNVYLTVFSLYLLNDSNDLTLENLKYFFYPFFERDIEEYVKEIITPKISASINDLTLALEFPERYLIPIDEMGKIIEGAKSQLQFHVGSLGFSTETGFTFENQSSFTFTRSLIANTGLSLYFDNAKIDFRKDSNIPEATAAGYADDFVGVYIETAEIGLPAEWGHDDASTAVITGKNLLIGTGGFSGTVGMFAKTEGDPSPLLKCKFGNLLAELDAFDITFKQNAITDCNILGAVTIPGFTDEDGEILKINIQVSFDTDGNFEISATEKEGILLKCGNIFTYTLQELTIGRQDDRFYLETSGDILFTQTTISALFKDSFHVQDLRIWDDGKIELKGGSIPLPKGFKLKFGPTEIFITSINFGSIQKEFEGDMRKYSYWGFDGGVSIDPGGVDAKGTGIKFCYTVDNKKPDYYISVESLSVDLVIPGKAKPEDAVALISGWLSISKETIDVGNGETIDVQTYAGGIDMILPKAKLAASADMKFAPDVPAFIIDLSLELPSPIPLGPTGMGIYGFRGLFGHHYVTSKSAVSLPDTAKWYDYYKVKPEGIAVQKFKPPMSPDGKASGFSAGAGVSLATAADSGKAFSSKIFLLLSMPDLFMLEGKATILSERVGLTSQDPPFFAFIAVTSKEIETGFGVTFKMPKDSGNILTAYAAMNAAFYFHNPKAWYLNIGTKEAPNTGRLLDIVTAESFLMLSAVGIEVGAKAVLAFKRTYIGGSLKADVGAYIETGGKISFERFQVAAYLATGGHVDVAILGFGFYIYFDTTLLAEAPKPFKIYGSVHLAVGIKILGKKIKKEFTVEFSWEKSKDKEVAYISPISIAQIPAKAVNMLSQETFDIEILNSTQDGDTITKLIPCDSYIDIEFEKSVNPEKVTQLIGGVGQINKAYIEVTPPDGINVYATHNYSLEDIKLFYWDATSPTTGSWKSYNPYGALVTPLQSGKKPPIDFKSDELLQIGHWQLQNEAEYKRLRILSQSVFSYMDKGLKGWVKPEQYGITPASIFCVSEKLKNEYTNWTEFPQGKRLTNGSLISKNKSDKKIRFSLINGDSFVSQMQNSYGISKSLYFRSTTKLRLHFLERTSYVNLKLFTYSQSVTISYYQSEVVNNVGTKVKVAEVTKTRLELLNPVEYTSEEFAVDFVDIQPSFVNTAIVNQKVKEINSLREQLYETTVNRPSILALLQARLAEYYNLKKTAYDGDTIDITEITNRKNVFLDLYNTLVAQRNAAYAKKDRFNLLYTTAKTKMDSCCITMTPNTGKSDREICVDNLGSVVPDGTSLEGVENAYTNFITSLTNVSSGIQQCKTNYATNVDSLCTNAHGYLDALKQKQKETDKEIDDLDKAIASALENIDALDKDIQTGGQYPQTSGYAPDSTVIHQVEWMSLVDAIYNNGIPSKEAVQMSYQNSLQAIENRLSPIWRPHTTFKITVKVKDTISNRKGFILGGGTGMFEYNFGFKTGGPVGYFHTDYNTANAVKPYTTPEISGQVETTNLLKYKLTTLRDYIDYERSYPIPSGNLVNAKPLFYENTELNLFYVQSYVYHLLNGWEQLGSLPAITGELEVVVKDPLEEIEIPNPPPANVDTKYMPKSVVGWDTDTSPRIPKGIKAWDIMHNPTKYVPEFIDSRGYSCWTEGGYQIKPASLQTTITLNFLRPSTLYTAIFYNKHNELRKEVHRYVFQTSRYASLQEQVNSYIVTDKKGNIGKALYTIETELESTGVQLIKNLLANGKTGNTTLDGTFTSPYDCFMQGILRISPLAPAETTEFNIVRNTNPKTGVVTILGVIVRSPEPLMNPKIPVNIKNNMCTLQQINTPQNYQQVHASLYSKDCSEIFITHKTNCSLMSNKIALSFTSYVWDGSNYVVEKDSQDKAITITTEVLTINQQ